MNKILNSKIFWITLSTILIILIILVLVIYKENNNSNNKTNINNFINDFNSIKITDDEDNNTKTLLKTFKLNGNKKVTLTEGDEYIESGYVALDSNNNDISNLVKIDKNLDTKKPGTYTIRYILTEYDQELIREVEVVKKSIPNITLIGDEVIYLILHQEYNELGVKATLNKMDVSEYVDINGNIDTNQTGTYTIEYSYQDVKVTRKVIVFDLDSLFNITNEKNKTTININLNDNILYIKMPDNSLNSNKIISYNINKNGTYSFYVYTLDNQEFKEVIDVNTIEEIINVQSIKINEADLSLTVGETKSLTTTIKPQNATNQNVTWSTSDNNIATVVNGVVTAKKAGNVTITVKTADGSYQSTCKVTVKNKQNELNYNSKFNQTYTYKSSNKNVYQKEANNKTYIIVKADIANVLSKIGKQEKDQCRDYAAKYVNQIFKSANVSHTSSSSRLRTSNKQTFLWIMAQELLQGRPTIIRVTGSKKSGNKYNRHYVTVVGILNTANLNKLNESDFLIIDPLGYIRRLGTGAKGDGTTTSGRYLLDGKDKSGTSDRSGYQIYVWTDQNTYLKIKNVKEDPK
ncbi:MAG: DUF5011 domain-containing protein [Bacilli bacterium]|nr:DUF5011 domain-containing protein [Bacilli bacterium]